MPTYPIPESSMSLLSRLALRAQCLRLDAWTRMIWKLDFPKKGVDHG
ncbi:MAG: hypothetical protein M0P52_12555 [Rhodoferax sp.]|jgi:hypothetical protein|nr:hypothetical protein [Rhodoferax sp.]